MFLWDADYLNILTVFANNRHEKSSKTKFVHFEMVTVLFLFRNQNSPFSNKHECAFSNSNFVFNKNCCIKVQDASLAYVMFAGSNAYCYAEAVYHDIIESMVEQMRNKKN